MNTPLPLRMAAVVVTFNRANALRKTIFALLAEGIAAQDIIVIDNNSEDETRQMLKTEFAEVQAHHLPDNIASAGGFAKGMQLALEAGYDWVLLFNDDSRPAPGALSVALPFLNDPATGLLKIGNTNDEGKAILLYWKGVRVPKLVEISNIPVATDLVTFDGCFVSRKLMEAIGFCDPQYFMGTYEFDYCLKAKKAGFGIYTIPNGMIDDEKLGSAKGTPPWRQYYNTRNHLALALKLRSVETLKGWLVRELKYTYAILRFGDKKGERLLYKIRAIRDAILGRRGKVYLPKPAEKAGQ